MRWIAAADQAGRNAAKLGRNGTDLTAVSYTHLDVYKRQEVYLRAYESASIAKHFIGQYIAFYNELQPYGGGYPGNVAIYPDAKGTPTYYTDTKLDFPLYCTYDDEGNLFVSADDPDIIGELSEGSGSFENVTVNEDIDAASLQWDDGHLVAASYGGGSYSDTQNVYQVQILSLIHI